jgi:hypothetical protein
MEKMINSIRRHIFSFVFLLSIQSFLNAQNNTITDVLNNTVTSCTTRIGTVVNVSSTQQLLNAINTANANGGNMTILIADGTYQIASTTQYPYVTVSNLVIRSASGKRNSVILTGGGMRDAGGVENGFYFTGNNITVADLTIRNVGNHGIATHGDNIVIHNVRFQDTYEQMLKGTNAGDGPDNGIVRCCLFEYTAGIGPQFYIGGIDIHMGDGWLVQDNVFRNIKSPSNTVSEHSIHFWDNSSNNTIERNLIINCDRGIGFGLGDVPNNGGIIRNNMIYNDGTGTFSDVGISLETSPNSRVYNNTIYLATYPNAIEYRFSATSNVYIQNNLCNRIIRSRDGASAILGTNVTNAQASWFVRCTAGNLRLASSIASVVDKGTSLSNFVTNDIDKKARPSGAGIDIGAHEYSSLTSANFPNEVVNGKVDLQNYPNPFFQKTILKYSLDDYQYITLKIYNFQGQEIKTLVSENKPAGTHTVEWDGTNSERQKVSQGIYFCQLKTSTGIFETKKLLMIY